MGGRDIIIGVIGGRREELGEAEREDRSHDGTRPLASGNTTGRIGHDKRWHECVGFYVLGVGLPCGGCWFLNINGRIMTR